MEYGTKVLHEIYGEGFVINEQIGMLTILFKRAGIIGVRTDDTRLKLLEGVF